MRVKPDFEKMKLQTMQELEGCTDPGTLREQAELRLHLNNHLVGRLYPAINWAEARRLNGMAFDLEHPGLRDGDQVERTHTYSLNPEE